MTARDFLDRSMGMIRSQGLWAVWGALLRRDFIADSGLQFRPGLIVGEDCVFMWQALLGGSHSRRKRRPAVPLLQESHRSHQQSRPRPQAPHDGGAPHIVRHIDRNTA